MDTTNTETTSGSPSPAPAQRDLSRGAKASIAILSGLLVALIGVFLVYGNGSNVSYTPTSASEVVSKHLPQVAIVGQKAGPADSTEVFIQVPGVMNMQSVYVLSDNKTVISGYVVPALEGGAVPGGQLEMPTGQPSVNPRKRRDNADQLTSMLKGQSTQTTPAPQSASSATPQTNGGQVERSGNGSGPRSTSSSDVPVPAPTPTETTPTPTNTPKGSADSQRSSNGSDSGSEGEQVSASTSTDAPLSESAFRSMVRENVSGHELFKKIQNGSGAKDQQQRYFDAVKSRDAIVQGNGKRDLYVFIDPNCPVCHKLYSDLADDVGSGELTVHWIPATLFSNQRSSIGVSSQLLGTLDRRGNERALTLLRRAMTSPNGVSSIFEDYSDQKDGQYIPSVALNTALMASVKPETPFLVFENLDGDLAIETGIPSPGYVQQINANQG